MKHISAFGIALLMTASLAHAGGVDMAGQSVAVIFAPGDRVELSLGRVAPHVSGELGAASGNVVRDVVSASFAYKTDLTDTLSFALILDQPFGADIAYPEGRPYFATGTTARLETLATTAVLRYAMPSNISVFVGLRHQILSARAHIPFLRNPPSDPDAPGYAARSDSSGGLGYVLGAAYSRPDIALRIALSYNSRITHDLKTEETGPIPRISTTKVTTPQSVNLEFQTGVAQDTLLFGSMRWVEWGAFDITPQAFLMATGEALVFYDNDTVTSALGLGHRFSDTWAGLVTASYEASGGNPMSDLGPTDGSASIGVGATFTQHDVAITGLVHHVWIGDAKTRSGARFKDNSALALGMTVAFTF